MENICKHTHFAPQLLIPNGTFNIDFYINLGAIERFCYKNEDGSIHVAELEIGGALFHLHETMHSVETLEPIQAGGVTTIIGLFVDDVHLFFNTALAVGAMPISPVTDYDYGYRQGMFKDPFGHCWQIQKKIR